MVSQQGCRVVVLPACQVEGVSSYATNDMVPTKHGKHTRLSAQAAMDMPWIGARGDASGEVSYSDVTVANHSSSLTARTVLRGACAGATHVVMGYSTGAFQLQASTVQSGRMDNSVVSGQANASAGILNSQGDLPGCQNLTATDRVGAAACGAVVDLELAPLAQLCAGHGCVPGAAPVQPAPGAPPAAPGSPAPAVAAAPAASSASSCTSDLPACQQRCEGGDREACSALGSACTFGFNAQACDLYWRPILGLAAK